MHYYLTEWVWDAAALYGKGCWRKPHPTMPSIDLRSPVECAEKGTVNGQASALPSCLIALPFQDNNLALYLGGDRDVAINNAGRNRVCDALGIPRGSITATTLLEAAAQLLVEQGDPTGQFRWKPLASESMHCGDTWAGLIKANPNWENKWRQTYQEDYRSIRQECIDGLLHPGTYKKWLSLQAKKHGRDYHEFIPADLPDEGTLPYATDLGDTFVEGSDTALSSHTATGPNSGFSWSYQSGTWTVISASNDVDSASSEAHNNARADSDLSSADHYSQADVTLAAGTSRDGGVMVRCAAAADTAYIVLCADSSANYDTILYRNIAGSYTEINDYGDSPGVPTARSYKLDVSGSTLTPTRGGTPLTGQTDTNITGNVRTGIRAYSNNTTIDNFVASDGAAAGASPRRILLTGVG